DDGPGRRLESDEAARLICEQARHVCVVQAVLTIADTAAAGVTDGVAEAVRACNVLERPARGVDVGEVGDRLELPKEAVPVPALTRAEVARASDEAGGERRDRRRRPTVPGVAEGLKARRVTEALCRQR